MQVLRLLSRAKARVRRDGIRLAIRYYWGAVKDLFHYILYDRHWDRLELNRTGMAMDVDENDVLGPVPERQYLRHHAFPRLPLRWAIDALALDHTAYSFIDYGSGRGRAILAAASLPFDAVVGIEFSRTLHKEALENIASYPKDLLRCSNITSLNMNVADFTPPDGNFVAFSFNPLSPEVLEQVIRNIERTSKLPRSRFIIFANTQRSPLFKSHSMFHRYIPPLRTRMKLCLLSPVPIEFFYVDAFKAQLDSSPPTIRPIIERKPTQFGV